MNKKVFYLDAETTGLDPKKNDIIQLAYLIEIDGEVKEEGDIYCQPFDYNTVNAKALEVNQLSTAKIKEFPTPQEAYGKLIKILDKYVDKYDKKDKFSPAGYNAGFDTNFLKQFFFKNNNKYYGAYFDYHILDPSVLLFILEYRGLLKLENYKLETVCKHFGIELKAHNAMSDIKATREVFYKLLEYLK